MRLVLGQGQDRYKGIVSWSSVASETDRIILEGRHD